jgi:mRNA interferase MazF
MRRGEIWTVAGGAGYAGKPRPAVIVQDDAFGDTGSIAICGFTTNPTEAPMFRLPIRADARHQRHVDSHLMVDKITAVPRSRLGMRLGELDTADVLRLNRALLVFLGLGAGTTRSRAVPSRRT